MASRIKGGGGYVVLNRYGMRELLKSKEVASMLRARMSRVQAALPGSELEVTRNGRTRARAKVARGSDFDEANTGELGRALSLAGGRRGTKVKTGKRKSKWGPQ